jgi:hypothetical protein
MVAAGAHPKYLQAQMGHSSIRVILDLYGHLFPDAKRGVLESLDALTTSKPRKGRPIHAPSQRDPRTCVQAKAPVTRGFENGRGDGTRTRDLRRDRPVRRNRLQPATTRNCWLQQAFPQLANRLRPATTG